MYEAMSLDRRGFFSAAAITAATARLGVIGSVFEQIACAATRLSSEGDMPSLGGATQWLNSQPLTTSGLRGKVVVVQFCTYSCINWLRTLPYVRAWADKYKSQGLVVIGAHTRSSDSRKTSTGFAAL